MTHPLSQGYARGGKVGGLREGLKYLLGLDKLETPDPNLPATVEPQLPSAPVDPQTALMDIAAKQINKPMTRRELLKGAAQKAVQSQLSPLMKLEKLTAPAEKAKAVTPGGFFSMGDFTPEQRGTLDYLVEDALDWAVDNPEDYTPKGLAFLRAFEDLPDDYLLSKDESKLARDLFGESLEDVEPEAGYLLENIESEKAMHSLDQSSQPFKLSPVTSDYVFQYLDDEIFGMGEGENVEGIAELLGKIPELKFMQKDFQKAIEAQDEGLWDKFNTKHRKKFQKEMKKQEKLLENASFVRKPDEGWGLQRGSPEAKAHQALVGYEPGEGIPVDWDYNTSLMMEELGIDEIPPDLQDMIDQRKVWQKADDEYWEKKGPDPGPVPFAPLEYGEKFKEILGVKRAK